MIKHITWLLLFIGSSIILYSQDNLLDNYSQSISPTEISWITIGNLSGITWNKENNRLYMIENGDGTIWVSDYSFNLIRTIEGGSFGDTEDMAHLSGNEFAIVTEAGELFIGEIPDGDSDIYINPNDFQKITFDYHEENSGAEGVTYDSESQIFYIVKEKNPMRFFQFQRPATSSDTVITPDVPFDAEYEFSGIMDDLSSITYDDRTNRALILSDDSHRLIDVNPTTGNIHGTLNVYGMDQPEGICFYNDNYDFVIVGEPNFYTTYTYSLNIDDLYQPTHFSLHQNYPNPFNPITALRYDLPEQANVNIIIYDIMGREVKTLVNQTQDAGFKSVLWNATNDYGKPVSAGVYLYQIQAGDFVQTKKMVLLK